MAVPDARRRKVLTVGPDINGLGGISAVLQMYRRNVPGFAFSPTNSRRGTIAGAFVLGATLLKLPFYRLAGYDTVHAHGGSGKSYIRKRIVLGWARRLGFRTVFHCHGGGFAVFAQSRGKERVSRELARYDAVAVLSGGWRRYFAGELGCRSVTVIDNMVELPAVPVERREVPEGEPVRFVFLGKLCRDKGVWDLLDALASERDSLDGRIKVSVGGNGDVDEFRRRTAELGLEGMVEYVGCVYGADKDALLRRCDVMLLPSYIEGMPITLLEAGVYAMPSITTTVGGIPELITDGVQGTLLTPGDVPALAAAIKNYAGDRQLILRQGCAAAEAVRTHLPDAVNAQLDKLYDSLS